MGALNHHLRLEGPEATRLLGQRIAAVLEPGDFVGLSGELGAGKTALVRAVCESLGVSPDVIASPTFAIVNAYEGRFPVHHADLYRIESADELHGTGLEDLVGGPSVLLVEWIDRAYRLAPQDWLHVELEHAGPGAREATLIGRGPRGAQLASLVAAG